MRIGVLLSGLLLSPLVAITTGCATSHLGTGHGQAYRAVFAAQADGRAGEDPAPMDADDAHRTLARHRGGQKTPGGDAGAGYGDGASTSLSSSSSGVGDASGNPNPIRLEAK